MVWVWSALLRIPVDLRQWAGGLRNGRGGCSSLEGASPACRCLGPLLEHQLLEHQMLEHLVGTVPLAASSSTCCSGPLFVHQLRRLASIQGRPNICSLQTRKRGCL